MKLSAQRRLHLYGLVQSLSLVVRLNDIKTAQHLRARLALVLRNPPANPLRDDLTQLFEVSGLWVRHVGNRHETKLQLRRLLRRIIPQLRGPLVRRNRIR